MAFSKLREGDILAGQKVVQSGVEYGVQAVMLVDSAGNEAALSNGTAIGATSGNVANASAVATLAAPGAGITNYLTGFEITFSGATAASVVVATVTGLLGGTRSYIVSVPAGATVGGTPLIVDFSTPIPASAANTAIVVTLPALGAGNTNACVNARGFKK